MPKGFSVQVRVLPPSNIRRCGKQLNLLYYKIRYYKIRIVQVGGVIFQHQHHRIIICVRRAIGKGVVSRAGRAMIRIDRGRYFRQLQQFRQLVRICVFRSYQCIICTGQSYLNLVAAGKIGNNILGARPVCQYQDKIIIPCPADR